MYDKSYSEKSEGDNEGELKLLKIARLWVWGLGKGELLFPLSSQPAIYGSVEKVGAEV